VSRLTRALKSRKREIGGVTLAQQTYIPTHEIGHIIPGSVGLFDSNLVKFTDVNWGNTITGKVLNIFSGKENQNLIPTYEELKQRIESGMPYIGEARIASPNPILDNLMWSTGYILPLTLAYAALRFADKTGNLFLRGYATATAAISTFSPIKGIFDNNRVIEIDGAKHAYANDIFSLGQKIGVPGEVLTLGYASIAAALTYKSLNPIFGKQLQNIARDLKQRLTKALY
jgi:hypothetical protein